MRRRECERTAPAATIPQVQTMVVRLLPCFRPMHAVTDPAKCAAPMCPHPLPAAADPSAMMLATIPPLFMHIMHPRLDAWAAARAAEVAGAAAE